MSADQYIHALTEPATEADLAVFNAVTIGSKWCRMEPPWPTPEEDAAATERIIGTPQIWIGQVSWLGAALSAASPEALGPPESNVPAAVQAIEDLIGEEFPVIDDALIDGVMAALALSNQTEYRVTRDRRAVRAWLRERRGLRAFTVSW